MMNSSTAVTPVKPSPSHTGRNAAIVMGVLIMLAGGGVVAYLLLRHHKNEPEPSRVDPKTHSNFTAIHVQVADNVVNPNRIYSGSDVLLKYDNTGPTPSVNWFLLKQPAALVKNFNERTFKYAVPVKAYTNQAQFQVQVTADVNDVLVDATVYTIEPELTFEKGPGLTKELGSIRLHEPVTLQFKAPQLADSAIAAASWVVDLCEDVSFQTNVHTQDTVKVEVKTGTFTFTPEIDGLSGSPQMYWRLSTTNAKSKLKLDHECVRVSPFPFTVKGVSCSASDSDTFVVCGVEIFDESTGHLPDTIRQGDKLKFQLTYRGNFPTNGLNGKVWKLLYNNGTSDQTPTITQQVEPKTKMELTKSADGKSQFASVTYQLAISQLETWSNFRVQFTYTGGPTVTSESANVSPQIKIWDFAYPSHHTASLYWQRFYGPHYMFRNTSIREHGGYFEFGPKDNGVKKAWFGWATVGNGKAPADHNWKSLEIDKRSANSNVYHVVWYMTAEEFGLSDSSPEKTYDLWFRVQHADENGNLTLYQNLCCSSVTFKGISWRPSTFTLVSAAGNKAECTHFVSNKCTGGDHTFAANTQHFNTSAQFFTHKYDGRNYVFYYGGNFGHSYEVLLYSYNHTSGSYVIGKAGFRSSSTVIDAASYRKDGKTVFLHRRDENNKVLKGGYWCIFVDGGCGQGDKGVLTVDRGSVRSGSDWHGRHDGFADKWANKYPTHVDRL